MIRTSLIKLLLLLLEIVMILAASNVRDAIMRLLVIASIAVFLMT